MNTRVGGQRKNRWEIHTRGSYMQSWMGDGERAAEGFRFDAEAFLEFKSTFG